MADTRELPSLPTTEQGPNPEADVHATITACLGLLAITAAVILSRGTTREAEQSIEWLYMAVLIANFTLLFNKARLFLKSSRRHSEEDLRQVLEVNQNIQDALEITQSSSCKKDRSQLISLVLLLLTVLTVMGSMAYTSRTDASQPINATPAAPELESDQPKTIEDVLRTVDAMCKAGCTWEKFGDENNWLILVKAFDGTGFSLYYENEKLEVQMSGQSVKGSLETLSPKAAAVLELLVDDGPFQPWNKLNPDKQDPTPGPGGAPFSIG